MRLIATLALASICIGCELEINNPAPVSAPTGPTPVSITTTNNNNNTNNNDRSDTAQSPQAPGNGSGGSAVPLPLPTYGEMVTRDIAAANPTLLANSCQETTGESAWQFLDLVIRTLRGQDQRWGYLCKDPQCVTFARDIVAYKATAQDTGIWIVDVIGNHCPGPGTGDIPTVRWGVLPFETARRWAGARVAGVFP